MPNIKSAIKRVKTSEEARTRNHALKGRFRTAVKQVEAGLESKATTPEQVRAAISAIDKAAQKGAIHSGQADRRKSRLMKRVTAAGITVTTEKKATPKATKPAAKKPATKKAKPEVPGEA